MARCSTSATWFLTALMLAGCYYGDLSVHGKKCSNQAGDQRTCPGGFVCVEHPVSKTSVEGFCIAAGSAISCQAPKFCNTQENWVEECQSDGYSTRVEEDCDDSSLQCNPDTAQCARSCVDSDMDCPQTGEEQTCDLGTLLCRPFEECVRCAPNADQDVTATPSAPKLDCFKRAIGEPPVDPATCTITGRVYMFPLKNSRLTEDLEVILHPAGDPVAVVADTTVFITDCGTMPDPQAPCGYYEFLDVPTNQVYDLEVRQPENWEGDPVTPTVRAGVTLRADRCQAGTFSLSLNVMPTSTYQSYTSGLIDDYNHSVRGLLIGRVLDCGTSLGEERQPLGNVKVGLAIPPASPGRIYYFPEGTVLAPDPGLSATTTKGYYAVVGVPACRNQVEFAAKEQGDRLDLGIASFTMRPSIAIIIDSHHPLDMLPPGWN